MARQEFWCVLRVNRTQCRGEERERMDGGMGREDVEEGRKGTEHGGAWLGGGLRPLVKTGLGKRR